jgi:hypothetical protein
MCSTEPKGGKDRVQGVPLLIDVVIQVARDEGRICKRYSAENGESQCGNLMVLFLSRTAPLHTPEKTSNSSITKDMMVHATLLLKADNKQ